MEETVLRVEDAIAMRGKYRSGGHSFTPLSREYGVSVETASKAIQGRGAYKEIQND